MINIHQSGSQQVAHDFNIRNADSVPEQLSEKTFEYLESPHVGCCHLMQVFHGHRSKQISCNRCFLLNIIHSWAIVKYLVSDAVDAKNCFFHYQQPIRIL